MITQSVAGSAVRKVHAVRACVRNALSYTLVRLDRSEGPRQEYDPKTHHLGRLLLRPTLLGFFASCAILAGASQPNSPFTLKTVPGAWWFGIPTPPASGIVPPPGQGLFLGVVAVYAGILLLLRAWYDVVMLCIRVRNIPYMRLLPVFVAWVLPLLIVAPLFSRDAYSYVAQGELMAHHLNPYIYGPKVLGVSTQFTRLTDPLWQLVTSPYGPMFLTLAGWTVDLSGHSPLVAVEGMRALALFGTVLFAFSIPVIAKSFKRDAASAFAIAALNPLVLLHLVAGAHNDALMLGLLAFGYALHRRGYHIAGILCCAFAALVKVPAILGAIYIGWEWPGPLVPPRERIRPLVKAMGISVVTMVAMSEALGLGWGWISGLSNPDTVRSWLDPATGVALFLGRLVSAIGLGNHTHIILTICRGSALLLAVVISLWLLWNAQRVGTLRALGFTLLAFVVLSPVVQPWYAAWGFVMLAPIAETRLRRIVMFLSGISCFLQLPGGSVLVNEITIADPIVVGVACAALVGLAVVLVSPRFRHRTHLADSKDPSPTPTRDEEFV
ncbi:MAG TPA: polyprenol phosphomannose-dependent alpha 1,6 mannosyltransferase MptB [Acidimicrobiales bacterium]|nr:polyprenol phosphomannose-dependent alpha 1,6 mannosyltransferase MptB [Acidimicrobiales bacterium]